MYSARNEQLIKPLFDAYKKETGVDVKFVTGQEGPLHRPEEVRRARDVLAHRYGRRPFCLRIGTSMLKGHSKRKGRP